MINDGTGTFLPRSEKLISVPGIPRSELSSVQVPKNGRNWRNLVHGTQFLYNPEFNKTFLIVLYRQRSPRNRGTGRTVPVSTSMGQKSYFALTLFSERLLITPCTMHGCIKLWNQECYVPYEVVFLVLSRLTRSARLIDLQTRFLLALLFHSLLHIITFVRS